MNLQNLIIVISLFLFLLAFFKRFKILIENTNYSDHKKIAILNDSPIVIGGVYLLIIILIFFPNNFFFIKFISILILILGLLSDKNLFPNPTIRLLLQILILFILVYFENLTINTLSINFLDELLSYKFINIIFTVLCFTIILNGSNFLDGLNGLLSGYYLLILGSLIYINVTGNYLETFDVKLIILIFTTLLIFYIFNIFGLVYLGDSGSYLISMIIGIILIKLYQRNIYISPYYVAAMLWYPAFENLFSLLRRIYKKTNISSADQLHLHQLIFRFLKTKKIFNKKIVNPVTSVIILLCNMPSFIFATINLSYTKYLVLIIMINVLFYLLAYSFFSKNLVIKK